MIHPRIAIGALSISAGVLVGIAQHEGYVEVAAPPVPGDVDTNGFGSTKSPDGSPIKRGDKTDPVRALVRLYADADKYSQAVRRCAPVPMHQYEFDAFTSLAYNIGPGAFCSSTLAKMLNRLEYAGACEQIKRWDKFKGRTLRGLAIRREAEYKLCKGAA